MSPAQIIVNILNILNSMEIHLTIMHILATKLPNQWTCFRMRHLGMCEALGTPGGKVELCLIQNVINIRGAIYQHCLNLIRACISNHTVTQWSVGWNYLISNGIPWNCSCQRNWRILSSMEFHGIPWNCWCQRNWRILSFMEFHGIPWNCSCQRNWRTLSSMEFHGTSRVIEIGAL